MRKVIVSEFVSLDSIMEEPKWTFPYWNGARVKRKKGSITRPMIYIIGKFCNPV